MRVLVTGAGGQLGVDVLDAFADHDAVGLTHPQLDVADEAAVTAAVRDLRPALVVHCAAWTDVDGCEVDPDRAHRVNALGSWWVARACALARAAMVALSSDYVFGDARRRSDGAPAPWGELDPVAPLNEYGRSKAAAEQLVRGTLREHYVVRTARVFGARGHNFVRTMLQTGREQARLHVVDAQYGSPTFTRDLARAIRELAVTGRYGTYHRTNSGACTWYELAAAAVDLVGLDVELIPIDGGDLDQPAVRPAWSVLDNRHSVLSGLSPLPCWRDGLARMLDELRERGER